MVRSSFSLVGDTRTNSPSSDPRVVDGHLLTEVMSSRSNRIRSSYSACYAEQLILRKAIKHAAD